MGQQRDQKMKLTKLGIVLIQAAAAASSTSSSKEEEKLARKPRQRFYGQRYTPQGYDYNYNYPRYDDDPSPESGYQRPHFVPSRNRQYDYQPSIQRNGYYQQNGEYSFRVKNQFKNDRVPVARPGHLARQGGRKVRPPGVLDDRVLNPRTKNMNGEARVIDPKYGLGSSGSDYDSSSSSEYEHKIAYTYDQDYTAISEESYDTDDFVSSGDDVYMEPIKINELVSDGPHQQARPSHPAHPDENGLADILTDPNTVQQSVTIDWMFLSNLTCALEEGCLSESAYNSVGGVDRLNLRKLLRFTQKITNIGDADFLSPVSANEWQYHTCHANYHAMRAFTTYELLSVTTNMARTVASSHKASYCLEDTECMPGRRPKYTCQGEQALSPGCSDIHDKGIDCQWIDVTDVPSGHYILKIEVNPGHVVKERTYENNILHCDVYVGRKIAWAKNCRN